MNSNATVRFIQISDIHLYADPNRSLLGVNTRESFQAVVARIEQETRPFDFIFLSGDLTQDGSINAYQQVAELLERFHVPIYYIPGNHDHIPSMLNVYPYKNISNQKHIILKHWHLVLLNSQKTGCVEGYLDRTQLDFLQQCLAAYPEHHALVAMHHHPVKVGCDWLDKIGVENADNFWQIMRNYPRAKTVLYGHVHQENFQPKQDVNCLSTPSTCIQFKRQQHHFGLEKLAPGYRFIELRADGSLETDVCRVAEYVGVYDEEAKGY